MALKPEVAIVVKRAEDEIYNLKKVIDDLMESRQVCSPKTGCHQACGCDCCKCECKSCFACYCKPPAHDPERGADCACVKCVHEIGQRVSQLYQIIEKCKGNSPQPKGPLIDLIQELR